MTVCMKDFANNSTDMVLLYRAAFLRSGKVIQYFLGVYHQPPNKNSSEKKIVPLSGPQGTSPLV